MDQIEVMTEKLVQEFNAMSPVEFRKRIKSKDWCDVLTFGELIPSHQDIFIEEIVRQQNLEDAHLLYRFAWVLKKHKEMLEPLELAYEICCM